MKLIDNTNTNDGASYPSPVVYFPELDVQTQNGTELHPVVCDKATSVNLLWTFASVLSYTPFYFAFGTIGDVEYSLYSLDSSAASVCLYDYFNYSSSDIENGLNPLFSGYIGAVRNPNDPDYPREKHSTLKVKTEYPMVFLARVSPAIYSQGEYESSSIGRSIGIGFSNMTADIDCTAHMHIDWHNRINGGSWNIAGKVGRHVRLSDIGRSAGSP